MRLLALTVDDLLRGVDYASDSRSHTCTANLIHFYADRGVLDFVTRCSGSAHAWYQRVTIPDWAILLDEEAQKLTVWQQLVGAYPEVTEMDVKVVCNCPAFAFQGPSYIVDQMGAGDTTIPRYLNAPAPEGRPPSQRDPNLEHTLCKHLISVLRGFW
jgi:hypothetical protein